MSSLLDIQIYFMYQLLHFLLLHAKLIISTLHKYVKNWLYEINTHT